MTHTPKLKSSTLPEPCKIDFHERINTLHNSLVNQIESSSKIQFSSEEIFHRISIIFRFLRKNLQSQDKLSHEYIDLSNNIQKLLSLSTKYLQDHYDHENELLLFKDKLCQLLGQIGFTQYSLEQYWTMISSLEQEIERLQILLNNPQILQINQKQFQILQNNQKIKIDRIWKENERFKMHIEKNRESNQTIQIQLENHRRELRRLKMIVENMEFKETKLQNQWKETDQQTIDLQMNFEKTKAMENETNDRLISTKIQSNLAQKRFHSLTNTHFQTNQKLLAIRNNEINIKQNIENIKNNIHQERTRSSTCHDQMKILQQKFHQLNLAKHHTQQFLKSEEHTNYALERKRFTLENTQYKLTNQIQKLTIQLNQLNQRIVINEKNISMNNLQTNSQQTNIHTIEIVLKKIQYLNKNLEKYLQENRFLHKNEQESLRSIKQISFQKRKQLISYSKRLHIFFLNEHEIIKKTLRNSLEIVRLNQILRNSHQRKTFVQLIIRKKQTELMKHEKQRALLARYFHENENRNEVLVKKNQFIENELENKIEHFRLLENQFNHQNSNRLILFNQKQYLIYSYREQMKTFDRLHEQSNHLENFSENQINYLTRKKQENQRFKFDIYRLKQTIINMISQHKRQFDEYFLLNEKIHLYTKLNDQIFQQEKQCQFQKKQFLFRINNSEKNHQKLINNLQNIQKKTMRIVSSRHQQLLKRDCLNQLYQIRMYQPMIARDNSMHIQLQNALENYPNYVNQLMDIIHQCIQSREELASINQLYFIKIEEIYQQKRVLSTENEMLRRYKMESKLKQCKAKKAESRL